MPPADLRQPQPAQRGDHSSRSRIAPGLQQPTRGSERAALSSSAHAGWASPPLLFGLAPRGVFRAPDITVGAVGSYPTFSPLPDALDRKRPASGFAEGRPPRCELTGGLIFCGTFRSRDASANSHPSPLALPGALPCRSRPLRARCSRSPDFPPAPTSRSRRSPGSSAKLNYSLSRRLQIRGRARECFVLRRVRREIAEQQVTHNRPGDSDNPGRNVNGLLEEAVRR